MSEEANTATAPTAQLFKFPDNKIIRHQVDRKTRKEMNDRAKKFFANDMCRVINSEIYGLLQRSGFNMENQEFLRDMALSSEFLRSAVYRNLKIKHDFHDNIDNDKVDAIVGKTKAEE